VPDTGFLICNGAAVSRSTYGNLFSKVGTTYGIGNGTTTFNLPDLRERSLRGASSMAGIQVAQRALLQVDGCTTASGQQILTLGTATNIPVNSLVIGNGIPAGTQVIGSDNGTTVYLSAAATATANGTLSVVFSPLGTDLRTVGAVTPDLSRYEARLGALNVFHRLASGANGSRSMQVNVTGLGYSTVDLYCGMIVEGQGIPPGTVVEAFENVDRVYLSQALTATLALDPCTFIEPGASVSERNRWRERAALEPVINGCSTTNNVTSVNIGPADPIYRLTRLLRQGMIVTGPNIQPDTFITSISNSRTFLISKPASGTAGGLTLSFSYPAEYLSERIYPHEMNCIWQVKT